MHGRTVMSVFLLALAGGTPAQDGTIKWLDNYQEALRQARRTQKPVFLEFRCEA